VRSHCTLALARALVAHQERRQCGCGCRYAIEKRNYKRAVSILEALPMTLETEAMWNNLAQMALHDKFFMIAERCAGVARRTSAPPTARRRRHSAGLVSRVVAVLGPTPA
jgi:hypothetical protein